MGQLKELLRIETVRRQLHKDASALNSLIKSVLGTNNAKSRKPSELALREIIERNNELSVSLSLAEVEQRKAQGPDVE